MRDGAAPRLREAPQARHAQEEWAMADKRQALGRGLGALIPSAPPGPNGRPVDVFFPARQPGATGGVPQEIGAPPEDEAGPDGAPAVALTRTDRPGDPEAMGAGAADGARSERSDPAGHPDPADSSLAPVPGAVFAEVPVTAIRPNPRQPRTIFDADELAELVQSVNEIGILQPVVLRWIAAEASDAPADTAAGGPDGSVRYELVMGERRWRAAQAAGLEFVPAIIKDTPDDELLRDALLENLHRTALNPLEEAAAYQQLLEDFGCTQDELATRIGRSRPQVSNTLRLLRLPPLVQRRVAAGVLSAGHARALLGLTDAAAMERLAQRIVAEGLSVRTVEEIVTLGDAPTAPPARQHARPGTRHPQLDDYTTTLADRLDTRVGITLGRRKGRITVEFASVEDLQRILTLMGVEDLG